MLCVRYGVYIQRAWKYVASRLKKGVDRCYHFIDHIDLSEKNNRTIFNKPGLDLLDLLLKGAENPKILYNLHILIEDLFEVSKASSKNITLNIVDVDVVNLFKQVKLELHILHPDDRLFPFLQDLNIYPRVRRVTHVTCIRAEDG